MLISDGYRELIVVAGAKPLRRGGLQFRASDYLYEIIKNK